jgi:hypothetical protein
LRPGTAPDGTVTILFTDIEGSTQLNERLGDVQWLELIRAHHVIVREQVQQHGGFEVKSQGDGCEILASSVVKQATESAGDLRFENEREVELDGLAGTHTVYRVL